MSGLDTLLSRLEKVRSTIPGQYTALCPAHDDRSPSLSVTEKDGKVLLYCHAECSVFDILDAVGMEPQELFPPRVEYEHHRPRRQKMPLADAWHCVQFEIGVVLLAAEDVAKGKALSADDMQRLREAALKLKSIDEAAYGCV